MVTGALMAQPIVGERVGVRPLRIAHVTATFPPYRGGTGNVAYHNAAELARRGHEVRVVTAQGSVPGEEDPTGVRVIRLRAGFRIGNAPLLPALARAIEGVDLVHLHSPFYFGGEQAWWTCRRTGTPYVVTYHQDVLFGGPLDLAARLHHRLLGARILEHARIVAATSLDYARSSRLADSRRARLAELPNGVDSMRFRPDLDGRPLRARYGLGPDEGVILFVGALDRAHYFKGVTVLIEAAARLPNVALLIVGDGELRGSYEQAARAAGISTRVRFAGRVGDDELPLHYALAHLTVLPSTTRGEAFGLVLVESMATGTPVVASRLPGVRAVVDDGVTGLLAAPGDADELAEKIRVMLADPGLRARMGAAGRRKVEQCYDWSRIGSRLEELYARALAMAPERPAKAVPGGLAAW
jgi:glycosyltransferase involved in cell wall biosynthesis